MAIEASSTLLLIRKKKHDPWRHMVGALPALELRLWCRFRIDSLRIAPSPLSAPRAHETEWLSLCVCVELTVACPWLA